MKKVVSLLIIVIVFFVLKNTFNSDSDKTSENIANINNEVENVILDDDSQNNVIINNTNSNQKDTQNMLGKNSLENKTIAFLGDSLVRGYGNDDKGFDYYLGLDLKNTVFINNSKSGSTITSNSGEDNIVMINQARTIDGNPDIIVFDGGANDIMGYSLGFLNNDLKKEIGSIDNNLDCVINDLQNVIIELKNRYPNASLCYVQPFLLDNETISNLTR